MIGHHEACEANQSTGSKEQVQILCLGCELQTTTTKVVCFYRLFSLKLVEFAQICKNFQLISSRRNNKRSSLNWLNQKNDYK